MDDRVQLLLTVVMVSSLLAAAVFLAMMSRAGRAMRRTGGVGIVPFELAESPREADRLMRTWGEPGRQAAARSIHWDYGFIAAYVLLLAAAAVHVADRAAATSYGWLRTVEWVAAGLSLVTGLLDCVENTVMLRELHQHNTLAAGSDGDQLVALRPPAATRGQIRTTRTCAQIKFLCAGLVGITILVGFGIVEMSGHPTSTPTFLAMALAAAAAGTLLLLLGRSTAAGRPEEQPSDTARLPADQPRTQRHVHQVPRI